MQTSGFGGGGYNYFLSVTRRKAEVKSAASVDTEPTRTRNVGFERQTPVGGREHSKKQRARVTLGVFTESELM